MSQEEFASDREWPSCIQCGSDETVVVPKTGEWTCEDCGRQWFSDGEIKSDVTAYDILDEVV